MSPPLSRPLLFTSPDECEQAFYEALEGGDAEAVCDLWLDDDDVCCVHPGGPRLVGAQAVRASWRAILAHSTLTVRATASKGVETPTLAVRSVVEEFVVSDLRGQQVLHVISTNAYVKTPAGWKMILHHAAQAPADAPGDIEAPAGPLH